MSILPMPQVLRYNEAVTALKKVCGFDSTVDNEQFNLSIKHLKKFIFDKPEIAQNLSVDTVAPVCAYCHGDLRNMTVARKVKPMTMGWCVSCHQANEGPSDCWKCHK